jgi:hypothetical protein
MKKSIAVLLIALAFTSSAQADSWGLRLGYPLGLQYTIDNSFGSNTGLRIVAGVTPIGGILVNGQIDALFARPDLSTGGALGTYFGGGAHLFYVSSNSEFGSASISTAGVQATGGLEFAFNPSISAFIEANGGFEYTLLEPSV